MNLTTHPALTVLYNSRQLTIAQLSEVIGNAVNELYAEALKQKVLVTGPIHWIYRGMDGNPQTVFTLEVAIPVESKAVASGTVLCKKLPAFKCMRTVHYGEWEKLVVTYEHLAQHIKLDKLQPTGEYREIYYNIDFETPANNITEVQAGVNG